MKGEMHGETSWSSFLHLLDWLLALGTFGGSRIYVNKTEAVCMKQETRNLRGLDK